MSADREAALELLRERRRMSADREAALELLRERTAELNTGTVAHLQAMLDARAAGATVRQIAEAAGVSRATAHKIVRTS